MVGTMMPIIIMVVVIIDSLSTKTLGKLSNLVKVHTNFGVSVS